MCVYKKKKRKITCKDFLRKSNHIFSIYIKRFREPLNELRMSLQNLIVRFYFDYRCRSVYNIVEERDKGIKQKMRKRCNQNFIQKIWFFKTSFFSHHDNVNGAEKLKIKKKHYKVVDWIILIFD